jgi:hypothetical protein
MVLSTAVAVNRRANSAGAAGGISAAILGAALTRSIDIARGVDVITPVPLALALVVVGMPPQVPLARLL